MKYNKEQLKIIHRLCCNNLISQNEFIALLIDENNSNIVYSPWSHTFPDIPYYSTSTAASTDTLEENISLKK